MGSVLSLRFASFCMTALFLLRRDACSRDCHFLAFFRCWFVQRSWQNGRIRFGCWSWFNHSETTPPPVCFIQRDLLARWQLPSSHIPGAACPASSKLVRESKHSTARKRNGTADTSGCVVLVGCGVCFLCVQFVCILSRCSVQQPHDAE